MRESSTPVADTVEPILDEAPVRLGVLYGSHARGAATERSDVDVAVVFTDELSAVERTRARLELIERLTVALDSDDVDVTPFVEASLELRREICADGMVIVGSSDDFRAYCDDAPERDSRTERLAEFDDLLADIERVV